MDASAGSWLHVPPAHLHPNSPHPHPLAPATPPKPAGAGASSSSAGALDQAGGCHAVDERHRVSACSLEVGFVHSTTALEFGFVHPY